MSRRTLSKIKIHTYRTRSKLKVCLHRFRNHKRNEREKKILCGLNVIYKSLYFHGGGLWICQQQCTSHAILTQNLNFVNSTNTFAPSLCTIFLFTINNNNNRRINAIFITSFDSSSSSVLRKTLIWNWRNTKMSWLRSAMNKQ